MTGSKKQIQEKISHCQENSAGARQYPAALRAEIVRYLDREVQCGGHFAELCRELGVHSVLARRWRRRFREGGFAAVTVVEEAVPAVSAPVAEKAAAEQAAALSPALPVGRPETSPAAVLPIDQLATITLTSPGGWRIEGLSLDAVAALLPRLS